MSFAPINHIKLDNDEDEECPPSNNPHWLMLAIAVLPAILPVIIEKTFDAVSGYFERKREALEEEQEEDDEEEQEDSNDTCTGEKKDE